jgi:DNA-directed RNA polymerase specialized sigma24 family protein
MLSMVSSGSVSKWIELLKAGDPAAAQQIWERYSRELVQLARTKLRGTPRGAADESDVALSAFDSFCRAARDGRFPQLLDRDDLWQLLLVFTVRKAYRLRRRERQQKRGGGKVYHETALPGSPGTTTPPTLDDMLSPEPTPEFAAEVAEACRYLLERLGDPQLCTIAQRKMEGYTHAEIAQQLGCSRRTIDRKIDLIRRLWKQEGTT